MVFHTATGPHFISLTGQETGVVSPWISITYWTPFAIHVDLSLHHGLKLQIPRHDQMSFDSPHTGSGIVHLWAEVVIITRAGKLHRSMKKLMQFLKLFLYGQHSNSIFSSFRIVLEFNARACNKMLHHFIQI